MRNNILALVVALSITIVAGNFLPDCTCNSPLQMATFNVYQQDWSPIKSERRQELAAFLNGEFADFGKMRDFGMKFC